MKLEPDCIVCNLNAALMAIRELTVEEKQMREFTADIMQIPAMQGLDWSLTGSQLVEQIFKRISAASGNSDPFARFKEQQNKRCLELYPRLKDLVIESEDPLSTAVHLSIIGNSIDPMGKQKPQVVEQAIRESLANPLPGERVTELKDRLEQSRLVLYLGDNCGEIVFDKLLIETLKSYYDVDVTFVVRSIPTLNDATLREAKLIGMDDVAAVIENGIDGPLPGTILSRCSEQLQSLWSGADLVISKGGGNFDSLDEEERITVPLFYMLMCKCIPYRDYFDVPLGYPILSRACATEACTKSYMQ
jgi:damage-control phosphatase, subfamily I